MPSGWDNYLASRSSKSRSRLRRGLAQSRKFGGLEFEEFATAERSDELIGRLQRLDARTWQGQQGSGLFSTSENARFYRELLSFRYVGLSLRVYLATINGRDAAYSINVAAGSTLHGLKMGYDPDFASCSPGSLTMQHVGERASALGLNQVDLGPALTEEKRHWATHRVQRKNWWLVNRRNWRGKALEYMLRLHEHRKGKRTNRGGPHADS